MVVYRFLQWIENAPTPARVDAVLPLVRTALRPDLDARDRDALDAAMTILLDDEAVEVRSALAIALARQESAPRHVIVALSNDVPAVAEPVFLHSPCLLDGELIEAVASGGPRIQTAIARRPWVPARVSDALATEGCREAVLALVANPGSDLEDKAYRSLASRFAADHDIREALFARPDLPIAVRQSLIAGLGAKLNALMVARAWTTEKRAETVVREACDKATVMLAADAPDTELTLLIEHLRVSGQLTTALLLRSVCQGQIDFLETALVSLTGLPATKVYPILAEGREGAMRALFSRAGVPERAHPAFVVAIESWRDLDYDGEPGDRGRFARRMIERVLTRARRFAQEDVDDLIAMLRRLATEAAREAARSYMDEARARMAMPQIEVRADIDGADLVDEAPAAGSLDEVMLEEAA